MNDSTDSSDAHTEVTSNDLEAEQLDSDDSTGDAVSGATADDDGVPTPTGSIPPGPGTPDEDDTTDATALPPLKERMF